MRKMAKYIWKFPKMAKRSNPELIRKFFRIRVRHRRLAAVQEQQQRCRCANVTRQNGRHGGAAVSTAEMRSNAPVRAPSKEATDIQSGFMRRR